MDFKSINKVRYLMHKLPLAFRLKLYVLPYKFLIGRYYKKIKIDRLPLFTNIGIETINRCNGKCTFCPVNITQPQRPYAYMDDVLFKKIIDELSELSYTGQLVLFVNNEPFLDAKIIDRAKYAREKCRKATIELYTNGTLLNIEKIEEIIEYVDLLFIDDYTNTKNHSANIEDILIWRAKHKEYHDRLQIDLRKVDEVLTSRGGQAPNIMHASRSVKYGCFYPFKQIIIRPDGKCSLCCNDAFGKYTLGNVREESIKDIWYGKKYYFIRKKMIETGRKDLMLCKECDSHFFI